MPQLETMSHLKAYISTPGYACGSEVICKGGLFHHIQQYYIMQLASSPDLRATWNGSSKLNSFRSVNQQKVLALAVRPHHVF